MADIPTIFLRKKIDSTLGHETPFRLEDIIVTRGTKEVHTKKLETVHTRLENEGYKASKKNQYSI